MRMEPHILFADDNSDICELVQTLLQAAGFRVSTSDNAADVYNGSRRKALTP
jgi:DNA-binding NtrC family response regulator